MALPKVTYKVASPGFDDECPMVPTGATSWEAQEIRRLWRSIHQKAGYIAGCAVHVTENASETASYHPNMGVVTAAAELVGAQRELRARLDGVMHRHSVEEKAREEPT